MGFSASSPSPTLPHDVERAMSLSSSPPIHFLDVTASYLHLYTADAKLLSTGLPTNLPHM